MRTSIFKYNLDSKKITAFNYHGIVTIAVIIFSLVALLATLQKFLEFGSYPDYKVSNSLIFNFLMIVPFSIWIIPAIETQKKISHKNLFVYLSILIVSSVLIFSSYFLVINVTLFLIGFLSEIISEAFFTKYFSGVVQIHLVVLLFVHAFLFFRHRDKRLNDADYTEPRPVFGIQPNEIRWIEAFDHYVKVYTYENKRIVKRAKMKNLEKKLPSEFVRIHRKYIVNVDSIKDLRYKKRALYVNIGEESLRVSRANELKVKKLFSSRQN